MQAVDGLGVCDLLGHCRVHQLGKVQVRRRRRPSTVGSGRKCNHRQPQSCVVQTHRQRLQHGLGASKSLDGRSAV